MPVLAWTPHLKLCERDGSFVNEYRINAGRVEARALDSNGDPYPGYSEWVSVTPEEIKLHFVKHTPMAQWLKEVLTPGGNGHTGARNSDEQQSVDNAALSSSR